MFSERADKRKHSMINKGSKYAEVDSDGSDEKDNSDEELESELEDECEY